MIEEISMTLPNMPRLQSQTTSMIHNESHVTKKSILRESGDISEQISRAKQPYFQQNSQIPQQQHQFEQSPASSMVTSSKKVKLGRLVGKLNKSLEDFFLKDAPEDSSYVDDTSMIKHYANN